MKKKRERTKNRMILILSVLLVIFSIVYIEIKYNKPYISEEPNADIDLFGSGPRTAYVTRALKIGSFPPDFSLKTLDGKTIRLSDYKGKKPVIINFWATWCPPCVREMPMLNRIYLAHKDEFELLGVNMDGNREIVEDFVRSFDIKYPILLDQKGETKLKYFVRGGPYSFLINKGGILFNKKIGPFTEDEILENIKILSGTDVDRYINRYNEVRLVNNISYLVPPTKLYQGCLEKDCMPSIDKPKFIKTDKVNFMNNFDSVLLVRYNNISKAYPIKILVWHEVVNDYIDNLSIVITYSSFCHSGKAYTSKINNKPTEFGVSGKLYNNNLVIYDRETNSLWSQSNGESIAGELAGKKLKYIPSSTILWKDWKIIYPNGEVLSTETGYKINYSLYPYRDYLTNENIYYPITFADDRLHPKTFIYASLINNGIVFKETDILKKKFIEIEELIVKKDNDDLIRFVNKSENSEIESVGMFWFCWAALYHNSTIYSEVG